MTNEQIEICKALGTVRYFPGSFDKRLGIGMSFTAKRVPEVELTEKQNEWIYRLLYKYRKQLPLVYGKYKNNPFCSQLKKVGKE